MSISPLYDNRIVSLVLLLALVAGCESSTEPGMREIEGPEIISLEAEPAEIAPGDTSRIMVGLSISRSQPLHFIYRFTLLDGGMLDLGSALAKGAGASVSITTHSREFSGKWSEDDTPGNYRLRIEVSERLSTEMSAVDTLTITVR